MDKDGLVHVAMVRLEVEAENGGGVCGVCNEVKRTFAFKFNVTSETLLGFLMALVFLLLNSVVAAGDLKGEIGVVITGFRNDKGIVKVALYNSKKGFPDDNKKALRLEKAKIENGKAETIFNDISYGTYAVAVYHDENENDKLDENWLGIPKEGYGVSNNAKGVMGPPKYDDAKFDIKDNVTAVEIKICY